MERLRQSMRANPGLSVPGRCLLSAWAGPTPGCGNSPSSCAPVLHSAASSALRSQPRAGETAVVCTGAATLSWGATGLHTSPDWFSLSFWLKLSCLKSIPASLLRVPFPVRKGGDAACGCVDLPPDVHLGPQREAVPVGCLPYRAGELCSPLQRRAPLGKALSLLGRVRVVPFQKVSL